jgi:hypothetical protein
MGRSIAKALRHGQFSTWRATDEERDAFYSNLSVLDREVKDCLRAQRRNA